MRRYLLSVMLLSAMCVGCETCDRVDELGKCTDSGRCTRPHITLNWEIEAGTTASLNPAILEESDHTFVWTEICEKLLTAHGLYITQLRQSRMWCDAYSDCEVTDKAWSGYWQTMSEAAQNLLEIKSAMLRRLAENQEKGVTGSEKAAMLSTGRLLMGEIKLYPDELAMTMEKLGECLPPISLDVLRQAAEREKREAANTERGQVPEDQWEEKTFSSDEILEKLDALIRLLQQAPAVQ